MEEFVAWGTGCTGDVSKLLDYVIEADAFVTYSSAFVREANDCVTLPEDFVSEALAYITLTGAFVTDTSACVMQSEDFVTESLVYVTLTGDFVAYTSACVTRSEACVTRSEACVTLPVHCVRGEPSSLVWFDEKRGDFGDWVGVSDGIDWW